MTLEQEAFLLLNLQLENWLAGPSTWICCYMLNPAADLKVDVYLTKMLILPYSHSQCACHPNSSPFMENIQKVGGHVVGPPKNMTK